MPQTIVSLGKAPAGRSAKLRRAPLLALLALATASWAQADPLTIAGTGALEPTINYSPADPDFEASASISFTENLSVPSSLNLSDVSGAIELQITAPEGYRFEIDPDASTQLSVALSYVLAPSAIGFSLDGPIQISYVGLEGTTPASWNN